MTAGTDMAVMTSITALDIAGAICNLPACGQE